MVYKLKTWPEYFKAVKAGVKNFEVRENDRDYAVGDVLILDEYDPVTKSYTGDTCTRKVIYILKDHPFVSDGYVIMGFPDAINDYVLKLDSMTRMYNLEHEENERLKNGYNILKGVIDKALEAG